MQFDVMCGVKIIENIWEYVKGLRFRGIYILVFECSCLAFPEVHMYMCHICNTYVTTARQNLRVFVQIRINFNGWIDVKRRNKTSNPCGLVLL